jgi:hypothetical protein
MNKGRAAMALISGWILYAVCVNFGGILSAIPVPEPYFEWFGKQHNVLALFVIHALTFALPCFGISAIGSWITLRILGPAGTAARWCLGGIVLGWLYWEVQFILLVLPLPNRLPLRTFILDSLIPPVWAVLNVLAVPLGLTFSAWLLARHETGRAEPSGAI